MRIDYDTGPGLAETAALLLHAHGAPAAGAPPQLWVARNSYVDDNPTFWQAPVSGPDDVVPAIARTDLGRDDRALLLLTRVTVDVDGGIPETAEDTTNPNGLVVLAAAVNYSATLFAAGHYRDHDPAVQLTCFPGRRDFTTGEGLWLEALLHRSSSGRNIEPRATPGEVYGRFWAHQVAEASRSGGLSGMFAAWRVLRKAPDVTGPGVPIDDRFSLSYKGERDRKIARSERIEHAVKIAHTDWDMLYYRMKEALTGRPDADLRAQAEAEHWLIEPHMLLWLDGSLFANFIVEQLPPLEESLAAVRDRGGRLIESSLRRHLRRRDWWVDTSTPKVHFRARPGVSDQVMFVTDALPLNVGQRLAGRTLAAAAVPHPAPAPEQVAPPTTDAGGVLLSCGEVPAALVEAGASQARVQAEGWPQWLNIAYHEGAVYWQHPQTGAPHAWPPAPETAPMRMLLTP